MRATSKPTRQTVSLPAQIAREIKSLAKRSRASANHVIVQLIEAGLEARKQEKERFLDLADRLARSHDLEEQSRLKAELAHLTFGE